jgi:hypothetical protein
MDVLSVIPTDPHWVPSPPGGYRAIAVAVELALGPPEILTAQRLKVRWSDGALS